MRSSLLVRSAALCGLFIAPYFAMPQIFAQFEPDLPEIAATGSVTRTDKAQPALQDVSEPGTETNLRVPTATEDPGDKGGAEAIAAGDLAPGAISIERSADRVEFAGGIARLQDRDALVAAATSAFPTSAIVTLLVQEPTVSSDHFDAALVAISALSRLAEGRAEISGNAITVTGRALYAQTQEVLAANLENDKPEGWAIALNIDAPAAAAANGGAQCQQGVIERLAEDQVNFAVAAATLQPDTEPLLDELAEILNGCPDVAIEVAGHTDSDGSEAANRRLSQERAAAVRQALAERGIESERLSAVGYGQAQPIAPNDTPENKASNRRIELIVID